MTHEEKDLLLKDLCARLPYGVKCENSNHVYGKNIFKVTDIRNNGYICGIINNQSYWAVFDPLELKPYLFPISSITEEQWKEITDIQIQESLKSLDSIDDSMSNPLFSTDDLKTIEWCYANYIDIHNLIPMGLAIDATGLNIY